ncbi:MAG: PHB depolymerase family esterase [Bdellovibrionota bacterium]
MARTRSWITLGAVYVVALSAAAASFPTLPGLPGFPGAAAPVAKLENLKADPNSTTTSGVSSGAYMAMQLTVSLSSSFKGAGVVAGGPWHCAEGSSQTAQTKCMKDAAAIDVKALAKATRDAASRGQIEDPRNLQTARFYIYGSQKDTVVKPPAAERTREYLESFIAKAQIKVETSIPSGHGWATENFGNVCGQMGLPWLNSCGYDTAGNILGHLYGPLKAKAPAVATSLKTFDQSEFDKSGKATLAASGFVYVPHACTTGTSCRVHVALHGCQMSSEFVQDKFAVNSGLNEWAEANAIVVLYPQAKVSGGNPFSCWDWFGYTGADYDTATGPQIVAIKAMVDRLIEP